LTSGFEIGAKKLPTVRNSKICLFDFHREEHYTDFKADSKGQAAKAVATVASGSKSKNIPVKSSLLKFSVFSDCKNIDNSILSFCSLS